MNVGCEDVFWGARLLPFAVGLYKNKYLRAVRHSIFTIMPFLLAVSFLDILESLVLDPWSPVMSDAGMNLGYWLTGGLSGDAYRQHGTVQAMVSCRHIVSLGYEMVSVAFAMVLTKKLSKLWGADGNMASFCTLAAFFLWQPQTVVIQGDWVDYFAGRRFLPSLFAAFLSAWLFSRFMREERLQLKLPKQLRGETARYLSAFPSMLLTLLALILFSLGSDMVLQAAGAWLRTAVPLEIFQHPAMVFLYQFIVWVLWWFGLPGYGATSVVQEVVYAPAQASNQLGDTAFVFTSGFFEAGVMHVLGLMIAILVFSKHENWRSVSKFSLPAMFFNIQEPVIFCLPVVLNPLFLLPYLLAPLANTMLGWIAISWGIVPVFHTGVSWTMPMLLSASMGTGSFMGGVLQAVWLVMDIFIYAPFVITANMLDFRDEEDERE